MLERRFCDAATLFLKDVNILRHSLDPEPRAMPKKAHNVQKQKKSFQVLPRAGFSISNDSGRLLLSYRRGSSIES
jgi:hypothetical protein